MTGVWILTALGFLFCISLTCFIVDMLKSDEDIKIPQYKTYEKIETEYQYEDENILMSNDYESIDLEP